MSQSWNNKKRGAGDGSNTPRGSRKQGGYGGCAGRRGGGSDQAEKSRPAVSQDDNDMMDTEEMELAFLEDSEMVDDDTTKAILHENLLSSSQKFRILAALICSKNH